MKNLHAGVASIALLWSGQAFAQTTPAAQVAPAAEPGQDAGGSKQDEVAPTDENDIVVTAQRRSERLVDVPISITTVSSENIELAGQDSLMSLNKLVPGLYMSKPVYFLSPTVRGVGSTLSVSNESAVAVYIDGVYQPAQSSNVFDLASISGVEVVKGPQGTLFGRNATGGAILVKTLDPSFHTEGKLNLSYGRFNEVRANGYVNLPISDTVAVNAAVSYKYSEGSIRDVRTGVIVNEASSFAARGKLLFKPVDNLEVILTAAHTEYSDPTASNYLSKDGKNSLSAIPGAGPLATRRFQLSHDTRDVLKINADEYSSHINLDTGGGVLSSITALKLDTLVTTNDADNTYLPAFRIDFTFKQRTFSQEVNFTSPAGDNFSYVVGAFYYHNKRFYPEFKYNNVQFLLQDNRNESLAGYADGTYKIGDLAIIAGLRYTTEKRTISNALLPHPLTPAIAQGSVHREAREDSWSPRFGLRYALGERSNIYATFTRGNKSGSFNGTSLTSPGVTPESIDAFEVGYKASGPRFTFNTAAYLYNYTDIQASTLTITNGVALSNTVNAAKARIYGLELDGTYEFSDAFNIHASFGYTHGEYTSFPNAPGYVPSGAGYATVPMDASGNVMVRQPKFQASAQANYTVPIGDSKLTFTLSPSYNSRVYFDFANQLSQGPVFLLDGSIDLDLSSGMKVSVYGRNLTDRVYYRSLGYSTSTISASYDDPITYGIKLSYAF
ncbi:TonB-dependent receptor [Sphingomonas canadensis]|uniref:TonB-dependent receptor n=1 Tax=Sphingomonas canadensis TaxID=1219257 RepID=A0ABW3H5K6_9SPHN|nr:TonB-dependent receptor [Sphingomonas canadensis]MCW3834460.1 TonB-dependent receptor [Sphingomonas canadensis]